MRRFERSSSGGTTRSSPSHSVAALRSASPAAASSYARRGVEPPESATWPPAQAMSTSSVGHLARPDRRPRGSRTASSSRRAPCQLRAPACTSGRAGAPGGRPRRGSPPRRARRPSPSSPARRRRGRGGRRAARPARGRATPTRPRRSRSSRRPARATPISSGTSSTRHVAAVRAAVAREAVAAARRAPPAASRSRDASQPQNSTPAAAESGRWRTATFSIDPQRAPHLGRVERRGDALAPRRGAQPREVDHVGRPREVGRAREARRRPAGRPACRPARCCASRRSASTAPSWPCGAQTIVARSGTSSGSTIAARLSTCCGPISTSTRSRPIAMWPGLWTASSAATVAQASSVVRPVVDRGDDQPRRVVAPDPREPVLDLAAEAAVDDHDEVHHPRGDERAVGLVAAAEQLAQRRLDRARRRVPRAPDVLAHSLRHCRSPSSASASAGPAEPDV